MNTPPPTWQPRYTLTPAIARGLMAIEAARAVVETTPLPPAVEAELRHRARVRYGSLSALYRQYIGNDAARGRMSARAYTDDTLDPEPRIHA